MRAKRIHVRLQGGLGNQLFIWAAGFALATRLGATLTVDDDLIPKLNRNSRLDNRKFELGYFGIRRASRMRAPRRFYPHFSEQGFDYDSRFSAIKSSVVLNGYFQSWRYMEGLENSIRDFLVVNAQSSSVLEALKKKLGAEPWVGVHVRRGDYLRVGVLNVVGPEYYRKAVPLVKDGSGAERVVVFSDDVGIARDVVPGADHYIGSGELESPPDTLMLMSEASAFVGANSSLSWWASFLSSRPAALNVFPSKWFSDSSISTPDLLIETWRRL